MAVAATVTVTLDADTAKLVEGVKRSNKQISNLQRSVDRTRKSFDRMKGAILASVSALGVRQVVGYADAFTSVNNKIKLVTDSENELTTTRQKLLAVSNNARVGLDATADLYRRMYQATETLNYSQRDLLDISSSISKSLTISGGSAASAEAALLQLSQGFASGTLRGQELNSVMEQAPRLARAIADGMGIAYGDLRKVAAQGELTTVKVMEALKSQAGAIDREFGQTTATVSSSLTVLKNNVIELVGTLDKSFGTTSGLTSGIMAFGTALRGNIPLIATIAKQATILGAAYMSLKALGMARVFFTQGKSVGYLANMFKLATTDSLGLAIAISRIGAGLKAFALANAPMAILVGIYETWRYISGEVADRQQRISEALDTTVDKMRQMTQAQRDYTIALAEQKVIEERARFSEVYRKLRDVKRSNPSKAELTAAQANYDTAKAHLRVETSKLEALKRQKAQLDALSRTEQDRLRHTNAATTATHKTAAAAGTATTEIAKAAREAAQLARNLNAAANQLSSLKIDLSLQSGTLNPLQAEYEKINLAHPLQNKAALLKSVDSVPGLEREIALKKFYTGIQVDSINHDLESLRLQYRRNAIGADAIKQKKLSVDLARKELEKIKEKARIDKSRDYSTEIMRAQINLEEKMHQSITASTRAAGRHTRELKKQRDLLAESGGFLNKLGRVESGNRYFGVTNKYGYAGRFQFRPETAAPFLKQLGATWADYLKTPSIQNKVVVMELKRNAAQLRAAGIKISELTLWMSHNQGVGGTKQILSGHISPEVRRNISTNIPKGMAPTAQNYIAHWSKTFKTTGVDLKELDGVLGGLGKTAQGCSKSGGNFLNILSQIGEGMANNDLSGFVSGLFGPLWGIMRGIGSLFAHKLTPEEIRDATGAKKFAGTGFEAIYSQFNDAQWKLLDVTQKSYQHLASMDRTFKSVAYALNPSSSGDVNMMAPSGENYISKHTKILFGLFEQTRELISSGLMLQIDNFVDGFEKIQTYYTEKVTSSVFFGLFTSESIVETFKDVDPKTVKAFNSAVKEGYDSIIDAAVSMGFDKSKIEAQLKKANLKIGKDGKIDLKGLSPEEQSKRIQAAFSEMFSGAVSQVGDLNRITNKYIEAGENQYETLLKLAMVDEQVSHGLGFLGIKLQDIDMGVDTAATAWDRLNAGGGLDEVRFGAVADGIHQVYTATEQYLDIARGAGDGDLDSGAKLVSQGLQSYYDNFLTKSEQLHSLTSDMGDRLNGIDKTMPDFQNAEDAKAWFKDQMTNWDHASVKANEAHGKLIAMTGEYAEYVKALEALHKQFDKLNITLGLVGQTVSSFENMEIMAKGAGGMSELTSGLNTYFSEFFTKEEQLSAQRLSLQKQFAKIGIDMPKNVKDMKEWYKAQVEARKANAEAYGQVVALAGKYKTLMDLQKQLADQQEQSSKKLLDLYTGQYSPLTMLQKTQFASRVANNTEGGALKALEMAYKSARTQEDYAKEFNRYAADLARQSNDATLKDVADKLQAQHETQLEQAEDIKLLRQAQERTAEILKDQGAA